MRHAIIVDERSEICETWLNFQRWIIVQPLNEFYDDVYRKNKNAFFLKYRNGTKLAEEHQYTLDWLKNSKFSSGTVVDFGCGEGDFLSELPVNLRRIGIDFSEVAIATAKTKYSSIEFWHGSVDQLLELRGNVECLTSFGTLEHIANPKDLIHDLLRCLTPNGKLILTCPSFLNIRGVIWMSLVKLFNVPMSLSDRHFITPNNIKTWLQGTGRSLETLQSFDIEVAQGADFSGDMKRRLTNALRDAKLDNSNVDELLEWVDGVKELFPVNELSGANMVYLIG
jgi:2-polyprenyl-3-methyl-5-hydroxy-6-metoxy-1,4-benzoquinol methylase